MTDDLSVWRIRIVPEDYRERGTHWEVYAPGCPLDEDRHEPTCECAAFLSEKEARAHVPQVSRRRRCRIEWIDLREAS